MIIPLHALLCEVTDTFKYAANLEDNANKRIDFAFTEYSLATYYWLTYYIFFWFLLNIFETADVY